jgi:hypothetical protein
MNDRSQAGVLRQPILHIGAISADGPAAESCPHKEHNRIEKLIVSSTTVHSMGLFIGGKRAKSYILEL